MILLIVVIVGVSIFCFVQGYIWIGFVCLLGGFSHSIGFITLTITAIYLYAKGHWIIGTIPLLLIAWNILGITVFKPPSKTLPTDVFEKGSR